MCSVTENHDMRNYVRNCTEVEKRNALDPRSFTSIDLDGLYDGVCPYFSNCALTLNFGQCKTSDLLFSFVGYVGLVTQLDNSAAIPQVWVRIYLKQCLDPIGLLILDFLHFITGHIQCRTNVISICAGKRPVRDAEKYVW